MHTDDFTFLVLSAPDAAKKKKRQPEERKSVELRKKRLFFRRLAVTEKGVAAMSRKKDTGRIINGAVVTVGGARARPARGPRAAGCSPIAHGTGGPGMKFALLA
ncbi:hypothetical protein EVAR_35991_1 [Eumeta japonica]|uniref:Uncharacterized protein n=1 Tax=Eumeta variegata TaxID=151549 RepID=A0A4C1WWJ4_EUMVA|nr:hypothetical protein EVAR_35991_1 [Eumeta japonica]